MPEPNSREPEFKPYTVVDGAVVTDPKGQLFVRPGIYLNPFAPPPPAEPWKPAERNSAEGAAIQKEEGKPWQMSKVLAAVEKTARNFSTEKQMQWAAIREFHRLYPTADSVPALPIQIRLPTATYSMSIGPCGWTAGWARLAFRFPRPNHPNRPGIPRTIPDRLPSPPTPPPPASGLTGVATTLVARATTMGPRGGNMVALAQGITSNNAAAAAAGSSAPTAVAHNLTLLNEVSGANAPVQARTKALADEHRQQIAQWMRGKHLDTLERGKLYFVRMPETVNEGRLQVGLGEALTHAAQLQDTVKFKWYGRVEWLKGQRFEWSLTPSFTLARNPSTGRIPWTSEEKLSDVLTYFPVLTPAATMKNPRLTAECVRQLTVICEVFKLVRTDKRKGSGGGPSSGSPSGHAEGSAESSENELSEPPSLPESEEGSEEEHAEGSDEGSSSPNPAESEDGWSDEDVPLFEWASRKRAAQCNDAVSDDECSACDEVDGGHVSSSPLDEREKRRLRRANRLQTA